MGGLEGGQGKGRFRGFFLRSKGKGPGINCSPEFTFWMLQSNKLKTGVFFLAKNRAKTLTYFNIKIFYEVRLNQKTSALFLCPALVASKA